jgi:isoquinoline 1-oxidoreductase subunit beta
VTFGDVVSVNRRDFLKICPAAAVGLMLGVYLRDPLSASAIPGTFSPNAFLSIDDKGLVTIVISRSEIGQGIATSLAAIVADELEADWTRVRIRLAPFDAKYGDQNTGGSESIRTRFEPLRKAGAAGRQMLVAAFAQKYGLAPAQCQSKNGFVAHAPSGRRASYGELAEIASKLAVPKEISLKQQKEFRLIGKSLSRIDAPAQVTGRQKYGLDHRMPGMLVATVARCPVCDGKVTAFDAAGAKRVPGVREVLPISRGVAVVADSTWAAIQGREALRLKWDEGPHAQESSGTLRSRLDNLASAPGKAFRNDGDVHAALAGAARRIDANYELPFLAHAPMEPPNCIAHVVGGRCEIWAPTQSPQFAHAAAKRITGLPDSSIRVNVLYSGGGFGRRFFTGEVEEAVEISMKLGLPIQVVWSRDDDLQQDYYRPVSYHRLTAGLDAEGWPIAWHHRFASTAIGPSVWPGMNAPEALELAGAVDVPYSIPNVRIEYSHMDCHLRRGWLRSVQHSFNAFAVQSFIDELAAAAGKDPLEYRLHLLREPREIPSGEATLETERLRRVIELAAERAGWGGKLPEHSGRGLAHHFSFNTYVAHVAEVSVSNDGRMRVNRVVCAVDCGLAVNPDLVTAQIEGGVIFGLSAALKGEITLDHGRVQQTNFHDYEIPRIDEAPVVEVHIVQSDAPPTGVGEPGVPPLAPAVANALYAAIARRVRQLPIRPAV